MSDTHKPRHIKDIAHLYISNSKSMLPPPSATLLVAGDRRRCFSGLHVAGLATALAARNISVHLFERSGLLPNAGYFMSLPPRRYLRWVEGEAGVDAGLGGVTIDCASGGCTPIDDGSRRPRIDVVHLPPVYPAKPFRDTLPVVRDLTNAGTVFLMLRIKTTSVDKFAGIVEDELGPATACVLHLNDTDSPSEGDTKNVFDLGRITGWMGALGDRVPAPVRDPDSPLACEFNSIGESLLFKINQSGRKTDASRTFGISG
jgi:hypothetical protein